MVDVYPIKGAHRPGEEVELLVVTDLDGLVDVTISHLARTMANFETPTRPPVTTLKWHPPADTPRGYGVDIRLTSLDGKQMGEASTAFDVAAHWTDYPRYGFLSDFQPGRTDLDDALRLLARHHINALQFYDWQYRHDQLVAPGTTYDDPLGRMLSLATIRDAAEAAHKAGMSAMAYVAIYAASAQFWRDHPEWALFDESGDALEFGENFLGLMDPTRGSSWAKHLLEQCADALDLGFDGIHLDQYGEPRSGANSSGDPVHLPSAFTDFISDLKGQHPKTSVTMNAVKNWPIEDLARSDQDFVYIELWPDTPTYGDVLDIILNARELSRRPVVVAAYVSADRPANVATLDSVLTAAGSWRIELGEDGRLLTDPYFPNHQAIPPTLGGRLRQMNDLAVRYLDLIGPAAHLDRAITVHPPDGVVCVARRNGPLVTISLVNLDDTSARWDKAHEWPRRLENIELVISGLADAGRAWFAAPGSPQATPLDFVVSPQGAAIEVPFLDVTSLIWFETQPEDATT